MCFEFQYEKAHLKDTVADKADPKNDWFCWVRCSQARCLRKSESRVKWRPRNITLLGRLKRCVFTCPSSSYAASPQLPTVAFIERPRLCLSSSLKLPCCIINLRIARRQPDNLLASHELSIVDVRLGVAPGRKAA